MPTWRDDKILELANQLSYSPAEKRRGQLQSAIDLFPSIEAAKSYPWDFIHFRITGFQPRGHTDHAIVGKVLRADLATLIEFLSDTLSIKVEDAAPPGDAMLAVEDVARKFNVSSKTIQRWRKAGLIALRYVYRDGRRRLGFLESAAGQFATANKDRVDRSASFKQLTDEERAAIIETARRIAAHCRYSIKDVSQHIARQLKRAPETIRYTLRRHDLDHPEAPIFPDLSAAPLPLLESGNTTERSDPSIDDGQFAGHPDVSSGVRPALTPERERHLQTSPIEFIPNPLFEHPDANNIILHVLPAEAFAQAQASVAAGVNRKASDAYMARMPRDLPVFLQNIFRQPLMPQELETDAFRRMNYLRYRAARLQQSLPENPNPTQFAEIESLLAQAGELKNQILQSNLRVAVHVARKHQRVNRQLMELVSDATIWLMRTIDTFDFTRPVRFSTYAGYAIMKNFARDRADRLTRRDTRLLTGQHEVLNALGDDGRAEAIGEQIDAANLKGDLHSVIGELPARDRELLTHHYGLDQTQPTLSLAQIGDKMGITKARVRQLEARALRNLRQLLEARRQTLRNSASNPRSKL